MATSRTGTTEWKNVRAKLIRDREHVCHWCGVILDARARANTPHAIELDHLVPVARGGTNDPDNLVLTCHGCNRAKSDKWTPTPSASARSTYYRARRPHRLDVWGIEILDETVTCKVHADILATCPHSGALEPPVRGRG